MSMQDPNRPARPRPGQSAPASRPATPIIAVVIAAVAGLIGLIVLRDVKSDAGNTNSDTTEITDTTEPTDDTTFTDDSSVPDVTLPVLVRTGAMVVVSNASGKKGAAGALTDELKARGYDAGKAFTANSGTLNDTTQVLVAPGDEAALAVAKSVMAEMGLDGTPGPLDESAPVKQSDVSGATVVILLGLDKAGQSLLPLAGDAGVPNTEVSITAAAETITTGS
ncbi:MAG: hypothetical protein F2934_10815 [Actinobacteria bacterium]|uniref:Unannotated protein n=1 Tax=freshwater metagenome TaxID=449393 RepID=A0A6J6QC80_9ZZZZ|nr:hypothetical protein [Actinomycetota bacterium]MSX22121.1 hypothetical protein [Actinomycetota bacterium]MSY12475.1 hypothetical protein [Actinomycetota bacterium]MSZ03477.1 hypothetical protein [Actinomycetota bacterium]MTB07604.1 hypothetical protein [Actinomycetota bacterium]